jgi:two-component system, NtrC family, response regulator AtoC
MSKIILIIDDNLKLCKSLCRNFQSRNYSCYHAQGGSDGIKILNEYKVDVVLLDVMLEKESGLDVLKKIISLGKNSAVIMMTGYGTIETAVQSIKMGAFDYIQKPIKIDKLAIIVDNASRLRKLKDDNDDLKKRISAYSNIVTQNQTMIELCKKVKKVAASDFPVLISGESGTGKELFADFIHANSPRANKHLQKINCASFPESLLDNELFGHEKGAFTGADSVFQGVFERSNDSSLFLDELGDMPLSIQAKILRAIQNQEIRRLGGKKTIKINVRFIAATNKDLHLLMLEKKFREDLYYRLNTATFYVPPLRKKKDDILLLMEHFLKNFKDSQSLKPKRLSDEVTKTLLNYDWPGNIRELKNTIVYAATVSSSEIIDVKDLPPAFSKEDLMKSDGSIRENIEKNLILKTLKEAYYNKKRAAAILSMSRSTLYAKMQKYDIPIKQEN